MEIGICDDEMDVCLSLAKKVRAQLPEADIRLFASAEELLAADHQPDLLFLDIRLTGMDGLEAARKLRAADEDTGIVFISGCPDHALDAFDVDALHYLVKPFADKKLAEVIRRAQRHLAKQAENEPQLLVTRRGEHIRVRYRDILWAEVFNRTVVLHTTRGNIDYYGRLSDLERELGDDFFRTHRAYLVNCRYVDSCSTRSIRIGQDQIPLAKTNHGSFMQHYMRYIKRQADQHDGC